MEVMQSKFEHVDLDLLTHKCLLWDMGNTFEISSLYHMSKGDIIIVQKHCNMKITKFGIYIWHLHLPHPTSPPPKKKTIYNSNLWTQNQKWCFLGSKTIHMCSIIIMSQKILELLCRNHFFPQAYRLMDRVQWWNKYIPATLLLGI